MPTAALSRTAASEAVEAIGWRYLLATLATAVRVDSLQRAVQVAAAAVAAAGVDADAHLRTTICSDRVDLVVATRDTATLTQVDVEVARTVTDAVRALGLDTAPMPRPRAVQSLEIAIDALDIAAVRPFWRAVLAYVDEPGDVAPGGGGPDFALLDPLGQGPRLWFQQLDRPRPQRNRIHLDINVPHDEADERLAAALGAGGVLVSDAAARAFWVLADAEGNEVCICTWQDRDP